VCKIGFGERMYLQINEDSAANFGIRAFDSLFRNFSRNEHSVVNQRKRFIKKLYKVQQNPLVYTVP